MISQEVEFGLHPVALRKAYFWTQPECFNFLYKHHIVRSFDTFMSWMRGRRNPREDVLKRTWDAYQQLLSEGKPPIDPSAISENIVKLEW
jgi:hypothetical protein